MLVSSPSKSSLLLHLWSSRWVWNITARSHSWCKLLWVRRHSSSHCTILIHVRHKLPTWQSPRSLTSLATLNFFYLSLNFASMLLLLLSLNNFLVLVLLFLLITLLTLTEVTSYHLPNISIIILHSLNIIRHLIVNLLSS